MSNIIPTTSLIILLVLALFFTYGEAGPTTISISYCGFSGQYCGESYNDDVYARSANVFLSYAIVGTNGAVIVDADHYPKTETTNWRNTAKRIFLSVGGPSNQWANAFASESNRQTFISTLVSAVRTYSLDGVDLDI